MGTLSKIKDALTETAQDMRERAMQVRDAVVETAKETRDRAFSMADSAIASGEKVRVMIAGDMDALQLLKKDHEMVNSMFEQLEALDGRAEDVKEGIFAQLKYELSTHALVEENLFYPALARGKAAAGQAGREDREERKDLVNEAYVEHALVKQLLTDLASTPLSSPEWKAKLTVLKENVQHHVEEEENELFDIAREVLDKEQLMKLGAQLQQEKLTLAEAGRPNEQDEAAGPRNESGAQTAAQKPGSRGGERQGASSHRGH